MPEVVAQSYELVAVDRLRPHPLNPRKGNKAAIAESIEANGFYGAVVAQRSTGRILAGKHRWETACEAGITQVPVLWIDIDEETALRILAADNRTSDLASYVDGMLAEMLTAIRGGGGFSGSGFSEGEFERIVKAAGDVVIESSSGDAGERPAADAPAEVCPHCGRPR